MKCPPAVKKAGCCRTCHREIKKTGAPGRKCHGGIKHHHKKHHSKRLKATLKTDKKKGRKHRCGGRCKCHRSCHRIAHKLYKHGHHAMKHAKKMKSKKMQSAVNKFMGNISVKHKKCHHGCNKGPKKHMKCPPAVKKAGCCRTCHREIKKTGAPGRKCHGCIKRHHKHKKSHSCKSAHCKCHRTCHRIAKKLYKHAHRARRHAKKTKNRKMMKAVGKFFKHLGMKHKKCHRGCHPHKKHMKCPPAVKKAGCCRTCHREIKKTGAPGRKCHGCIKHHHKKHHSKRLK